MATRAQGVVATSSPPQILQAHWLPLFCSSLSLLLPLGSGKELHACRPCPAGEPLWEPSSTFTQVSS